MPRKSWSSCTPASKEAKRYDYHEKSLSHRTDPMFAMTAEYWTICATAESKSRCMFLNTVIRASTFPLSIPSRERSSSSVRARSMSGLATPPVTEYREQSLGHFIVSSGLLTTKWLHSKHWWHHEWRRDKGRERRWSSGRGCLCLRGGLRSICLCSFLLGNLLCRKKLKMYIHVHVCLHVHKWSNLGLGHPVHQQQ